MTPTVGTAAAFKTVLETPAYLAAARGVLSEDLRAGFVSIVVENPEAGVPLGGGGAKVRVAHSGRGRRGGARVVFLFAGENLAVFLLTVFANKPEGESQRRGAEGVDQSRKVGYCEPWERYVTKAFNKIMAGLEDAHAYLNGERVGCTAHQIEVLDADVVAIRSKTRLSQPALARSIGIPLETLKKWEQGRRLPEGPARVLLALVAKRPSIVQDELGR